MSVVDEALIRRFLRSLHEPWDASSSRPTLVSFLRWFPVRTDIDACSTPLFAQLCSTLSALFAAVCQRRIPRDECVGAMLERLTCDRNETERRPSEEPEKSEERERASWSEVCLDVLWTMEIGLGAKAAEEKSEWSRLLGELVKSGLVERSMARQRTSPESLESMGVVRSSADTKKANMRARTAILYKQEKFNLFRESSEGYAKLVTVLYEGSYLGFYSPAVTRERCLALIGSMDLDPNRVLDTLLDTFELGLEEAWKDLVQARSSVSSFCAADNEDLVHEKERLLLDVENRFLELLVFFSRADSVAALIGFRLKYFHDSQLDTPMSLLRLISSLLKREVISLNDVFPYLNPSESQYQEEYQSYIRNMKELSSKIGRISLSDKSSGPSQEEIRLEFLETTTLPESLGQKNQAILLLVALLETGNITLALEVMNRLKSCNPALYRPLSSNLTNLLRILIAPFYALIDPRTTYLRQKKTNLTLAKSSMDVDSRVDDDDDGDKNSEHLSAEEQSTIPETDPSSSTVSADPEALPLVQDVSPLESVEWRHLLDVVFPFLEFLGPELYHDRILFIRVIRVLNGLLDVCMHWEPEEQSILYEIVEHLFKSSLLPAMCGSTSDASVSNEVWNLLGRFSSESRYRIYFAVRDSVKFMHPMTIYMDAEARTTVTKKVLSRVANDTVHMITRSLGKLIHANPISVLEKVVERAERYENQSALLVSCFRGCLSRLALDILSFLLVDSLSRPRSRLQRNGLFLEPWLVNLAEFIGLSYKRYPSEMELEPLLRFVCFQVEMGQTEELQVLHSLMKHLAGLDVTDDLNDDQISAQMGGPLLRQHAGSFLDTVRTKKHIRRLRDALVRDQLATRFLIALGQQLHNSVYFEEDFVYLKKAGDSFDRTQDSLMLLVDFLSMNLEASMYLELVPPVEELVCTYGLDIEVAFHIVRPALKGIIEHDASLLGNLQRVVRHSFRVSSDDDTWQYFSEDLFRLLWTYSVSDIYCPEDAYDKAIRIIEADLEKIQKGELPNEGSGQFLGFDDKQNGPRRDKKDKKLKREQERLEQIRNDLRKERMRQTVRVSQARKTIESCRDSFFPMQLLKNSSRPGCHFLLQCVIPRVKFSIRDAYYCTSVFELLMEYEVKNFSIVAFLDGVLKSQVSSLLSSTEKEASRAGRFIQRLVEIGYKMISKSNFVERIQRVNTSNGDSVEVKILYAKHPCLTIPKDRGSDEMNPIRYDKMHHIMNLVLGHIFAIMVRLLQNDEYMDLRNALLVLTRIVDHFPRFIEDADCIYALVHRLRKDERKDLQVSATRYLTLLGQRRPHLLPGRCPLPRARKFVFPDVDLSVVPPLPPDALAYSYKEDASLMGVVDTTRLPHSPEHSNDTSRQRLSAPPARPARAESSSHKESTRSSAPVAIRKPDHSTQSRSENRSRSPSQGRSSASHDSHDHDRNGENHRSKNRDRPPISTSSADSEESRSHGSQIAEAGEVVDVPSSSRSARRDSIDRSEKKRASSPESEGDRVLKKQKMGEERLMEIRQTLEKSQSKKVNSSSSEVSSSDGKSISSSKSEKKEREKKSKSKGDRSESIDRGSSGDSSSAVVPSDTPAEKKKKKDKEKDRDVKKKSSKKSSV